MRAEDGPTPSPLRIQFSNQFPKKLSDQFSIRFRATREPTRHFGGLRPSVR